MVAVRFPKLAFISMVRAGKEDVFLGLLNCGSVTAYVPCGGKKHAALGYHNRYITVGECSSLALQPWLGLLSERHLGYGPVDLAAYDVVWIYSPMIRDTRKRKPGTRWSQRVTQTSSALDLEPEVFTWADSKKIARSLKRSAEASRRRKASPFQSAMSMLNFYINRAGRSLPDKQKRTLTQAKVELRRLFDRSE